MSINNSDKARAYAYLTTKPNPHHSVGMAAKQGHWNLDHSVFARVQQFLRDAVEKTHSAERREYNMARSRKNAKKNIETYIHPDKERINNPPVGLVTPDTDQDAGKKTYAYDPHLDPQLTWAGKAEHTSFEVPTVSLHVHERIDPRSIIEAVRKQDSAAPQLSLFATPEENPPIRQAIEFYKHKHNWTNRLVAGDSLLVMNSLLEKEGLAGKVQMVYIDPPYGIRYGSNFQPFVNKRDVKDGKDDDLTQEPETIRAFRDTWELGIHSYLAYLRDRLLLARELLTESGSVFVQIGDENVHRVRNLMDEVFGEKHFVSLISYRTSIGLGSRHIDNVNNYLVWYGRETNAMKFRPLFHQLELGEEGATRYTKIKAIDGSVHDVSGLTNSSIEQLLANGAKYFTDQSLTSRTGSASTAFVVEFGGKEYRPTAGGWRTSESGMERVKFAGRILSTPSSLRFQKNFDDFGAISLTNNWNDVSGGVQSRQDPKIYAVQTATNIIQRCILMTTDPGDLVFDPTCGSGTTAFVAEQWGRRWITCDTSRVAVTLAKQRLMTANFDYYQLAHTKEGISSGFQYETVPHVTLGSIANNPDIKEGMSQQEIDAAIARHAPQETLYDQPLRDTKKSRVTGPFTVEAVPAPVVKSVDEVVDPLPDPHPNPLPKGEGVRRRGERAEKETPRPPAEGATEKNLRPPAEGATEKNLRPPTEGATEKKPSPFGRGWPKAG